MLAKGNCRECGEEANGTIGNMWGPEFENPYVCEFCYKHVLHMRPLLEQVNAFEAKLQIRFLIEQEQTPKVQKAIAAYLNELSW